MPPSQRRHSLIAALACSIWGAGLAAQDVTATTHRLVGTWEGTVGTGHVSHIRFTVSKESTSVHGTFDARSAGVLAWPVRISPDTGGMFRLTLPNGWTFSARANGSRISGMLTGNGQSAPFSAHRTTRIPPPYTEEEVVFRNGTVTLSGTVLSPRGKGPWPAVVLAHGSGEADRTADNFLGDYLARRGIAALLYDKRGVGKSTGEWRGASLQELAGDAVAGVRLMRSRARVDAKRTGVAGRSQGGQLAIISASQYPEVAFAIDISGSLVVPWKQMNYEAAANMTRDKLSKEDSMAAQAFLNEKWTVAGTGQGWDSLAAHVSRIREAKPAWLSYVQVPDKLSDIRDSWAGMMGFDYRPLLAHLTKPVLALFGERDTSTPVDETVAALRAGATDSRNPRVKIRVYANADHALLVWPDRTGELELPTYPSGYPEVVGRWIHTLR